MSEETLEQLAEELSEGRRENYLRIIRYFEEVGDEKSAEMFRKILANLGGEK